MIASQSACDTLGSLALTPSHTRLVVLEGGRSLQHKPDQHRVAGRTAAHESCARISVSRGKVAQSGTRFFVACAIALMVALALVWVSSDHIQAGSSASALTQAQTEVVVVRPGETLWDLASEHQVLGATTQDVIAWIEQTNMLSTSDLEAGQTLVVPA